eukprot:CAMPEP_0176435114 /NCGR_PEP_ID=MMETSP0127-20121128/17107_1 /TAXON_ID=938130 /ORGANISM="Platyophrya macrostoma, Strain WH" /LENGTH=61 /DNA_ID=CAMNT_0017818035 /DNA_START=923 /DNA_END=1108 /DNA_ORIENTATION=-
MQLLQFVADVHDLQGDVQAVQVEVDSHHPELQDWHSAFDGPVQVLQLESQVKQPAGFVVSR